MYNAIRTRIYVQKPPRAITALPDKEQYNGLVKDTPTMIKVSRSAMIEQNSAERIVRFNQISNYFSERE